MRFPTSCLVGMAACFLLISASAQAQPSADALRFPRVAALADLGFEPSNLAPAASHGRPFGLQKGYTLEVTGLLREEGNFPFKKAVFNPSSRVHKAPAGRHIGVNTRNTWFYEPKNGDTRLTPLWL